MNWIVKLWRRLTWDRVDWKLHEESERMFQAQSEAVERATLRRVARAACVPRGQGPFQF